MNNQKISNIVKRVTTSLDIKLHEMENTRLNLRFKGIVKGVSSSLFFRNEKNKIMAYFCLGHYSEQNHFSKKIMFSDTKTEEAIFKDLMRRLEIDSISEKVNAILESRAKKQAEEDLNKAELAAFQRFIPFSYTNYRGLFSGCKNGAYFELSSNKEQLHINTKNKAILLRICAAAAQILEEEATKPANNA